MHTWQPGLRVPALTCWDLLPPQAGTSGSACHLGPQQILGTSASQNAVVPVPRETPCTCVNPDVTRTYEIQTTTLQEDFFLFSVARYLRDFVINVCSVAGVKSYFKRHHL